MLKVKFWGVRGSVPAPLSPDQIAAKIAAVLRDTVRRRVRTLAAADRYLGSLAKAQLGTYGGNTSCVTLAEDEDMVVLDAGTGLRRLGNDMARRSAAAQDEPIRLLLSHYHWDHIMGFPFFLPAFVPGNRITIYSPKGDARKYFQIQHGDPFFPVELEHMGARLEFITMHPGRKRKIGHFDVQAIRLEHPGGALGYRISGRSGCVVYMSDTEMELKTPAQMRRYAAFAAGADVVIADSQYSIYETIEKKYWGHSSIYRFIDLLHDAQVRTLVMFHYDPETSDEEITELLGSARVYLRKMYPNSKVRIAAAAEGEEMVLRRKHAKG